MERHISDRHRRRIDDYIAASRKSTALAVFLTVLFGPLGCLYTNPVHAVVALGIAITLGLIYWPLVGLVWLVCLVRAKRQKGVGDKYESFVTDPFRLWVVAWREGLR